MLSIIIGIVIIAVLIFVGIEIKINDTIFSVIFVGVILSSLVIGLFYPAKGFTDWQLVKETELVTLSNSVAPNEWQNDFMFLFLQIMYNSYRIMKSNQSLKQKVQNHIKLILLVEIMSKKLKKLILLKQYFKNIIVKEKCQFGLLHFWVMKLDMCLEFLKARFREKLLWNNAIKPENLWFLLIINFSGFLYMNLL